MTEPAPRAKVWKRVLASILDFLTVFFAGGYAIGHLTGSMTNEGFQLTGWPVFALIALIAAYFWIGRRYAGGTLWDRIFRIGRPQPAD
jgi:hypothetical protein